MSQSHSWFYERGIGLWWVEPNWWAVTKKPSPEFFHKVRAAWQQAKKDTTAVEDAVAVFNGRYAEKIRAEEPGVVWSLRIAHTRDLNYAPVLEIK